MRESGPGKTVYPGTEKQIHDPLYVMRCPDCGWTCWSIFGEPLPCRCGGIMTKEKNRHMTY